MPVDLAKPNVIDTSLSSGNLVPSIQPTKMMSPNVPYANPTQSVSAFQGFGGGASGGVGASGSWGEPVNQIQQQMGPSPEQMAAQQQAAQVANIKKNIQNLVGNAMGVYESLYGNLGQAAASQKKQLEQQFGQQESELQQQFSQELPRIGTAYAGRGAYDSSWRINAEQAARDQMLNQLQGLGREREAQMGTLGRSVSEQEAQFKMGQDALTRSLDELSATSDVERLGALQSDIQRRISELQASRAGLQSQEAFVNRFQQIGGPSSRAGQVKAVIDNILGGAANPQLKQSVASGFIQSSGLPAEDQNALMQYLNMGVEQLTAPQTTTAPTA